MLNNHFIGAPTVGSHDTNPTMEGLQSRIDLLEQQLRAAEEQRRQEQLQAKKKEKLGFWGKIKRFFKKHVKPLIIPILTFIPSLINSIANLNRAKVALAR